MCTLASLVGIIVLFAPLGARAQSNAVDPGFQMPVFTVQDLAPGVKVLPDGRFFSYSAPFVNGFDRINGEARGNLLRFNADGTLDRGFLLDARLRGVAVQAVAPAPNGQLIIGGSRNANDAYQVYRLNSDGTLDPAFNSGAASTQAALNFFIRAVVLQADGKVLVGGDGFDRVGNGTRILVRLNTDGTLDAAFAPVLADENVFGGNGGITTNTGIRLQPDGKIVIAGSFDNVNGVSVPAVARLNPDGSLDAAFSPSGFSIKFSSTSTRSSAIRSVTLQPDGKMVLGGRFNPQQDPAGVNGTTYQYLVRLNPNGSLDSTFNAARPGIFASNTYSVELLPDGHILSATFASGGSLLRYNADGSLDTAYNDRLPKLQVRYGGREDLGSPFVYTMGSDPTGRVVIAGQFDVVGGTPRPGLARLNADGTLDDSVNPGLLQDNINPINLAVRPDGTILAAGFFDAVNGTPRPGLALLNADGSLNPFVPLGPFIVDQGTLFTPNFLAQPDGRALLFGSTAADANSQVGFTYLRLNADGSVDRSLTADPAVTGFSSALLGSDGRYLVSLGRNGIAQAIVNGTLLQRLKADGSLNAGFKTGIDTASLVTRDPTTKEITDVPEGDGPGPSRPV